MDRTLAGIHAQNPPHCLSLGAASREFGARKLGGNAHFANGVPVAQIYRRTKFRVPCSIERWENEAGEDRLTQQRRPLWNPSEPTLFAQSEETPRCAIANTRLPHGHANDLCQQRLGELAHLGMLFDSGGKWTTEASDDDFITRVLQLRQTAEFLQDVKGDFQTLAKLILRSAPGKRSSNARKTPANLAQQLAFLSRGDSGFQRMEKLIKQQIISLGKELSGFRRERVKRLRFARGRPLARLPDKPIAFQGRKMRADRVVSQAQRLGQLVDGSLPSAQQFYDLSARAGEKAITPTFHNTFKNTSKPP